MTIISYGMLLIKKGMENGVFPCLKIGTNVYCQGTRLVINVHCTSKPRKWPCWEKQDKGTIFACFGVILVRIKQLYAPSFRQERKR